MGLGQIRHFEAVQRERQAARDEAARHPFIAAANAATIAAEILTLRRFAPDLAQAYDPVWQSPHYRALAHRLVGARSRIEPV